MMKNAGSLLISLLMLGLVLGCSCNLSSWLGGTNSAQTDANTAANNNRELSTLETITQTAIGVDKTGVAECDEMLDTLERELQASGGNAEADFVVRNLLYYFKQQIAIQARQDIINKTEPEKAALAAQCTQLAVQIREQLNSAKN